MKLNCQYDRGLYWYALEAGGKQITCWVASRDAAAPKWMVELWESNNRTPFIKGAWEWLQPEVGEGIGKHC